MFTPGRGDFEEHEWIDIRLEERSRLKKSLKHNLEELRYNFWFEIKLLFRKRK